MTVFAMRLYLTLLLIASALAPFARADMLVTPAGDTLFGTLLAETDTSLLFDGAYGEQPLRADSVREIVLDPARTSRTVRLGLTSGDAKLYRNGSEKKTHYGMEIRTRDSIVTGEDGAVELYLYKNDLVRLKKNTLFTVQSFLSNSRDKLFERSFLLHRGGVVCLVREDYREIKPLEIVTPGAAITATASLYSVSYTDRGKTTVVDVLRKKGNVGLRPTRMEIGEVMLREEETAILDENVGTITEGSLTLPARERLTGLEVSMSKKTIREIRYPKRSLDRKWLYIGAGSLAAGGGLVAWLLLSGDGAIAPPAAGPEDETDYSGIQVTW